MIGIVVVSHGKLSKELVAATEHVVGEQMRFKSISIEAEDDIEARRDQIRDTAKACDVGKGVIILTDMFRDELLLSEAARVAADAGRRYINIASELLAKSS
jgi:mannose PTS system EIIA component